ncbi:MAG: hypothetical protein M3O66_06725, partial [Verrucomicrobiota bacterium]|nr:hypothetical protein [Verrucomicrobiota bacterium]
TLAGALGKLMRDHHLRLRFGTAGRARIEEHFQIETTVAPLIELLERSAHSASRARSPATHFSKVKQIGYLIDRWPDKRLPMLETELLELERRNIAVTGFACRIADEPRLTPVMEQLATRLEFLPDAMAIEAEWQANRALARKLENDRASEEHRAPAEIFLEQARFALALHKPIRERNISHLHATSSRALLCGLLLKKMLGVSLSATIEPKPALSRQMMQSALAKCVGGRTSDRKLRARLGNSFLFECDTSNRFANRTFRSLSRIAGFSLTGRASFWQEWSERLLRWSRETSR